MGAMASQIISLTIVYSGTDQINIKAPRHWPLWGEFTGTGEFPAQMASNAENVSIWWRHHVWTRHHGGGGQVLVINNVLVISDLSGERNHAYWFSGRKKG